MGLIIFITGLLFYMDLGFIDLVPMYPLYLTLLLLLKLRSVPYNLVGVIVLAWLLGISIGNLWLAGILFVLLVTGFLLFNSRYKTKLIASIFSFLLSGTAVLFAGATYGALLAPVITLLIIRGMNFEDK